MIALDLRAQTIDVGVDGVLVAVVAVAPDHIEELSACVDPAGIARELQEQVELLCRQLDDLPAQSDLALLGVDDQLAEIEASRGRGGVWRAGHARHPRPLPRSPPRR